MATTSQPRSLLSIARLNMARSRVRPSIINRVLMHQTCFGRSGGLAPISFPLFQGVRLGLVDVVGSLSGMFVLLGYRESGACAAARSPPRIHVGFQSLAEEKGRGPPVQSVVHDPHRTSQPACPAARKSLWFNWLSHGSSGGVRWLADGYRG